MIKKLKAYLGEVRLFQWAREEVRSIMEALKNCDHRVVGTKQVLRGLKSEFLARVYVANDADTFLYQRIVRAAEAAQVPVVRVPTMKELGAACGVEVASAAAGIAK